MLDGSRAPRRRESAAIAALIAIGTFLFFFGHTRRFEFLDFDDNLYVTENGQVLAGLTWRGLGWAFTTFQASNWHPLTWLSHMLDVEVFGLDAGAHHLVNVGLHSIGAAMVFLAFARMTGSLKPSILVAALFALHPLHVESVAWIAERKDVLSNLFGFTALWAWSGYVRQPTPGRYAATASCFALSLLAKPMWVTLPFLLLLLDVWPLQRLQWPTTSDSPTPTGTPRVPARRLVLEKLPLLALSAASSAVTIAAQHAGGTIVGLDLGLADRLGNAFVTYATYLVKLVWPSPLAVFYPARPAPPWEVAGAVVLILVVSGVAIAFLRRAPWLFVGWFWYLGTLVPTIGLVQVGMQSMADRYTYLPAVGLFVMVAWLLDLAATRSHRSPLVWTAAAVASASLSLVTWHQLGFWRDHETLLEHAIAVTPPNGHVHGILWQGLLRKGKLEKALSEAQIAAQSDPGNARHWHNLGVTLRALSRLSAARDAFARAVQLRPSYALAWANLSRTELELGDLEAAATAAREATNRDPANGLAWLATGEVFAASGQLGPALAALREATRVNPYDSAAWTQLAILQERAGATRDAGDSFRAATAASPSQPGVWFNLGVYAEKYGDPPGAIEAFRNALRLRPRDPNLMYRLGVALLRAGRSAEALDLAARLEPLDRARATDLRAGARR